MRNSLKIACILDEFSYECFKYECSLIPLDTLQWMDMLKREKPDLLFVESAWKGSGGAWANKIDSLEKKKDNHLKNLVGYCKLNNIPTAFWNKEDPIHYDIFITAASLFDYVFSTDSSCVGKYKNKLGHDRVYTLMFAAQPKLHNPIDRDREKLGAVAFAGSWYNNHPNRIKDMENILKPAFEYGLHVYDRNHNYPGSLFRYPDAYRPYIKGSVPYEQMNSMYKKYHVFLNVNIVTQSPTMFSRRVFELLACGTPVISGPSTGIERLFKDIVKMPQSHEDVSEYLNMLINDDEMNNRLSICGQREVFGKHTYSHRLKEILNKLGLEHKSGVEPGVSIITVVSAADGHSMSNVFENYSRQKFNSKELIIILNNSKGSDEWKKEAEKYDNVRILLTHKEVILEQCFNLGIEHSSFDYISNFKEENYYAPDFISDLMNAFQYSDADAVGKLSHYVFSEDSSTLSIHKFGLENKYVLSLSADSMIAKKSIFCRTGFISSPFAVDGSFFTECVTAGFRLYSADRYNFACVRKSTGGQTAGEAKDKDQMKEYKFVAETKDFKPYVTV